MTVIPEQVRQQLKDRFETVLTGPVNLTLYTRPGSSRLILPAGVGCATCQDAREMAELLRDAAPEKITLEVVDVTRDEERALADGVPEVPTIDIASDSETGRIRFQGLPTGTEFPRNAKRTAHARLAPLRCIGPIEAKHRTRAGET